MDKIIIKNNYFSKTILRQIAALSLVFFAACATPPQTAKSVAPPKDNLVGDVQEFEVDGIPVILRTSSATPGVSAVLFIKGGSSSLDSTLPSSTAYFAMNVAAASGTQNITKASFRRRTLQMGTYINGEDGRDYSVLSLRCLRESLDTSWSYFAGIITHPLFDQVEFDNLRRTVLLNITSSRNNADLYSRVYADSVYFAGHPYGRQLSFRDAQMQTLDQLQSWYKSAMIKSRLLLSVVGNISKDELTKLIHSSLGKLPQGSYTETSRQIPPKSQSPGLYFPTFNRKLPTNYVVGYYLIPSRGDVDYYPYIRLRSFFGGFVFNHIRVQHNLAYAPNVDDGEGQTSTGIITLQTPYVDSAIKIIYDDVDFFQQNRIRQAAIRGGSGKFATSNYVKSETSFGQAVALGQSKLMTGTIDNAFISYEKLASVTPEDLQAAAVKYLRNFNWVIIGDSNAIDRKVLLSR